MRIIKNGIYANAAIRFRCELCDCDFEAAPHEYYLDTEDLGKVYCTKCPECGFNIRVSRHSIIGVAYNYIGHDEKED